MKAKILHFIGAWRRMLSPILATAFCLVAACLLISSCEKQANKNTIRIDIAKVSQTSSEFAYEWSSGLQNCQVRGFLAPGSAHAAWIQINSGGKEIGNLILVFGMRESGDSVPIGINWTTAQNVELMLRGPNGQNAQKLLTGNGSDVVRLQMPSTE